MKRLMSQLFVVTVVSLSALIALTVPVSAQEADSIIAMDTLLAPWLPTITAVAVTVLTALGAWLSAWIKRKTGLQIEFFHRDTFQTAVDNAAGFIMSQAGKAQVDLRHPLLKEAVMMVNDGARDALDHFGLTEDQIAKRILAKLGLHQDTAAQTLKVVSDAEKDGRL